MDNEEAKAPGGRKKQEEVRPQWRVRLPPATGAEIVEAAKQNGRSISEEIERRVIEHGQLLTKEGHLHDLIDEQMRLLEDMRDKFVVQTERLADILITLRKEQLNALERTTRRRPSKWLPAKKSRPRRRAHP